MQRPVENQDSVVVFVTNRNGKTYIRDYDSIRTGLRACMSEYLIAFYITNRRRVKNCLSQLKKNTGGTLLRDKQYQCFPIFDTVLQFTEIFEGRHYRRLDNGGVFEKTTQSSIPECHNSGRYGYIKPKLYYYTFDVLSPEFKEGTPFLSPGKFFELRWNPEQDSPIVLNDCVRLRTTSTQYASSFEILSGEEVMATVFHALNENPRAEIIIPAIIYKFGAMPPSISDIINFERDGESEEILFPTPRTSFQTSLPDANVLKQYLVKLLKDDPELLNRKNGGGEEIVQSESEEDDISQEPPSPKSSSPLISALPVSMQKHDEEGGAIKEKVDDNLLPTVDVASEKRSERTLIQFLYSKWPALEEFDKSNKRVMRPFFRADKLSSANNLISGEKEDDIIALNERLAELNDSQVKHNFGISPRSLNFCRTKLGGCFLGIDKGLAWASLSSEI